MDLSVFAAQVLAVYYLSVGVGVLSSNVKVDTMIAEFEKSSGLMLVTVFFLIVLGMLMVEYHNIWVQDWTVLVTIIAWAILIKGVLMVAFPQFISAFKGMFKNMQSWGLLVILVGLVFGYFGFVA